MWIEGEYDNTDYAQGVFNQVRLSCNNAKMYLSQNMDGKQLFSCCYTWALNGTYHLARQKVGAFIVIGADEAWPNLIPNYILPILGIPQTLTSHAKSCSLLSMQPILMEDKKHQVPYCDSERPPTTLRRWANFLVPITSSLGIRLLRIIARYWPLSQHFQ